MPLPPELDPLGLSYGSPGFADEPDPYEMPWPPPGWQAAPEFAPALTDEIAGMPVADPLVGVSMLPEMAPSFIPEPAPPFSDELAGDPSALAPQPMPWDVEPPAGLPPAPSGVRALPGLVIREDRPVAPQYPLAFTAPGDPLAELPSLREEQVVDPFAEMTDEEGFARVRDLAQRDRVAFLELQQQHELVQQRKALADQLRVEDENIASIQANREIRERAVERAQADSDKIIADATELSKRGLDRKWFGRLDTIGKIGAVVGALTGGLMSKGGGPNKGIEFIDRIIDDDINDQKYQIEQARDVLKIRQGAVAEAYKLSGDVYMAAETARIATYGALIARLKTEQQNFHARGTMFLNHGKTIQEMQSAAQAAQRKVDQQRLENYTKLGEFDLKRKAQIETERQNRAQNALRRAEIDEQRKQREAAAQAKADEKALERSDKEAERVRQFSVSSPRPAIAVDDKGNPVLGPDGKPTVIPQQLTNADGKPWLLGSNEQTAHMKAKLVAASEIIDMIDEVNDIRDKVGGELMPWSDAKQKLDLLQERMRLVRKSGTQGMSSDKDFEALGASIGAKNLTSFIDQSPGLKKAREYTVRELNTEMRTNNYTGPVISFENKYGVAKNTPEDDRRKSLAVAPGGNSRTRIGESFSRELEREGLPGVHKDTAGESISFDIKGNPTTTLKLSPEQRAVFDRTARLFDRDASYDQQIELSRLSRAAAGDSDAETTIAARAELENLATKAPGVMRRLAQRELDILRQAGEMK